MRAGRVLVCAGLVAATATAALSDDGAGSAGVLHHQLTITIDPESHRLIGEDAITLPPRSRGELRFTLHAGFEPVSTTDGVTVSRTDEPVADTPGRSFVVTLPDGVDRFVVRYAGTIHHSIESVGPEAARGFSETTGTIDETGVFLAGYSFWYPVIADELVTFSLEVDMPRGWTAVSQGRRAEHSSDERGTHVVWNCARPQEEIFLVAGRFTEFARASGQLGAMVLLREADSALAEKYLTATTSYVHMYESLIGPYPYEKFALVENSWESGLGMPSFTLLGPTVLRLPFLVRTSYPHEILHNWWGNGVYSDLAGGNWSEGLTAYLADHLSAEQRGAGADYRVGVLQKYADYVSAARDFPLTRFRSRHSSSTEAVGYGKSAMFFHMLRLALGDDAFRAGLADFYSANAFRRVGYDELRGSFERASKKDLGFEFEQWISRTGAPQLIVRDARAVRAGPNATGWEVSATIEQIQHGDAYRLRVPVAVTMQGRRRAFQTALSVAAKSEDLRFSLPARPLRLDVDPEFDVFRRLGREEIPPALSHALGAQRMLAVLPAAATPPLLDGYRRLAAALGRAGPDTIEIVTDNELSELPADRALVLLGWENRFFAPAAAALSGYGVELGEKSVRIGRTVLPRSDHAFVLCARNPQDRDQPMVLVAVDVAVALAGLARKLPHYHKYSYLGFEGDEPANVAKGRWPVRDSPMTVLFAAADDATTRPAMAELAAREPLATLPAVFSAERMMETVGYLASARLAGRGLGSDGLDRAAEFIAERFRRVGLLPGGDEEGSYFQSWEEPFAKTAGTVRLRNVIGILPAKPPASAAASSQSVVVGAHYDHLGRGWPDVHEGDRGRIHPGADDNASGVAVLLELARVLGERRDRPRTVVFVAFTGEESGRRGSRRYVSDYRRYPAADAIAMINIDTVGRLGRNKLLLLGAASAREWVHIFRGAGYVTGVEVEVVTSSAADASDHISFARAGVPAVQLFSGAHLDYHRPTDSADRIDRAGLVKVAAVAKEAIEYLSARSEPLSTTARPAATGGDGAGLSSGRRVSLGTIPDFAFGGRGYRLSGVVTGSPAESAGMLGGDIIVRIDDVEIDDMRDLSDVLKTLLPGARLSITFVRSGEERTTAAELKER